MTNIVDFPGTAPDTYDVQVTEYRVDPVSRQRKEIVWDFHGEHVLLDIPEGLTYQRFHQFLDFIGENVPLRNDDEPSTS